MRKREMQAAIKRGIKLLDSELPEWRDLITLEKLDLGDECNCILGQSFGLYSAGLNELGLSDNAESIDYGFRLDINWFNTDEAVYSNEYTKLTQLWKEALS